MAELIVCTGKGALLSDVDEPTPATIVIDRVTGKITEIQTIYQSRTEFEAAHPSATIAAWVDAGDKIIIPGLVECVIRKASCVPVASLLTSATSLLPFNSAHVHLNEPGRTDWEGFWTGTRAAAAGGITTIVDMPLNSLPPTTTVANLEQKRRAAVGQCHTDVGFWGGVIPGNQVNPIPGCIFPFPDHPFSNRNTLFPWSKRV